MFYNKVAVSINPVKINEKKVQAPSKQGVAIKTPGHAANNPISSRKILINKHVKFRFLVPIQQNRISNQCDLTLTNVR